jgi:hypothetical protein
MNYNIRLIGHFANMSVRRITRKSKKDGLVIADEDKPINKPEQKIESKTEIDPDKQKIIDLFMKNVKGQEIILKSETSKKHCGKEGHWLEDKMGIKHNSKNEPDIFGYEMKKNSSKITFGDFSASEYLFSKKRELLNKLNGWSEDEFLVSRNEFIKYFGTPNPQKNNRFSWSGSCVPIYGSWNKCGQMLIFNDNNDLCAQYCFEKDERECKSEYPDFLRKPVSASTSTSTNIITIAIWKSSKLEDHINKKFNNKGFFICKKVYEKYEKICFGRPFDFKYFVENIKNKNIIFDSGMYRGNNRNYSQFRSNSTNFWNLLITEEF